MTTDQTPGPRDGGVDTWLADASVIGSHTQSQQTVAQMPVPQLVSSTAPHTRLYVACFDGTRNDMNNVAAGEKITNVAEQYQQLDKQFRNNPHAQIQAGYEPGVGTQGGLDGVVDSIRGHTYPVHLENMHLKFIKQAEEWKAADPQAEIGMASMGFSRGAVEAALFTRMVEERGIQSYSSTKPHFNPDGTIKSIEFTKPPLVEPGHVRMAAALYDPVNTGVMERQNALLPTSVEAGLQLTAQHERRDLFKSTDIIAPGVSANGRFVNATVGGAHSDIGGSYAHDGLSARSQNTMTDFLNKLSDKPFLQHREVPQAPDMSLVHNSAQHRSFYKTTEFDKLGHRAHVNADGTRSQTIEPRPTPATPEPRADRPQQRSEASEVDTLANHPNRSIVALNNLVNNSPDLAHHTDTERARITAALCLECLKTGKDISGMTEVESFEHKGKTLALVDDPVKAERNPYTSTATVDVAQATQIPVQDSLAQMQNVQVARAQTQEQSRSQSGPAITM